MSLGDGWIHRRLLPQPRVDRELLRELNGGLIALSGCLSGELARAMLRDDGKRARAAADEYAAILMSVFMSRFRPITYRNKKRSTQP